MGGMMATPEYLRFQAISALVNKLIAEYGDDVVTVVQLLIIRTTEPLSQTVMDSFVALFSRIDYTTEHAMAWMRENAIRPGTAWNDPDVFQHQLLMHITPEHFGEQYLTALRRFVEDVLWREFILPQNALQNHLGTLAAWQDGV